MVPTMVRSNHRYRGPVESRKVNEHRMAAFGDITALYGTLQQHQEQMSTLVDSLRDGQTFDEPVTVSTASGTVTLPGIVGIGDLARRLGTAGLITALKGGTLNGESTSAAQGDDSLSFPQP